MGEFFVIQCYDARNQHFKGFIMTSKFDGFVWGLILIAADGLFMAYNLGYDINPTPAFGMVVFGVLSALCFIRYFAGNLKRWGRLMPACPGRQGPEPGSGPRLPRTGRLGKQSTS